MTSSYSAYIDPKRTTNPTKYIDFNRLKSENPENLCTIFVENNPTAATIVGIIDPLSITSLGASAQYQDYFSNMQSFKQLQQYVGLISSATGTEEGRQMPQISLQSLRLSEQNYMGSTVNDMSLKMNVPIISQNDDPWTIAIGMFEYVLGERAGDIDIADYLGVHSEKIQSFVSGAQQELAIYAPHRYRVRWSSNSVTAPGGDKDKPEGCATIKVGSRFKFRNMLITRVDCSFNNVVYRDGKVTNLDIQFSFKPWRLPDIAEVKSWFAQVR